MSQTKKPVPRMDSRGPRVGAAVTAVLLTAVVILSLREQSTAATVVLALVTVLFSLGAFAGAHRHPYTTIFTRLIRPHLTPPRTLVDAAAVTFSHSVGLAISLAGLALGVAGFPNAVGIAAGLGGTIALAHAALDYCVGCQLYLLLVRSDYIRDTDA